MERKPIGEEYWYINTGLEVGVAHDIQGDISNGRYAAGNYFPDRESAESMASKLRAVLKGADVIEMPSEEELREAEYNYIEHHFEPNEDMTTSLCRVSFEAGIGWLLKSKIVK